MRTHPAARLVIIVSVLLTLFLPSAVPRYLQPVRHPSSHHYIFSENSLLRSRTAFGPFQFSSPSPSPKFSQTSYSLNNYRYSSRYAQLPSNAYFYHPTQTASNANNIIRSVVESPSEPDVLFTSFNPSSSLSPTQTAFFTPGWSKFVSNQLKPTHSIIILPSEPPSPSINSASSLLPSLQSSIYPAVSSNLVHTLNATAGNSQSSSLLVTSLLSSQPLDGSLITTSVLPTLSSVLDFSKSLQPLRTFDAHASASYSSARWSSPLSEPIDYKSSTIFPSPILVTPIFSETVPSTTVFVETFPMNGNPSAPYSQGVTISTSSALASVSISTSTMTFQISRSPQATSSSMVGPSVARSHSSSSTAEVTHMIATNYPSVTSSIAWTATETLSFATSVDVSPSDRSTHPSIPFKSPLNISPTSLSGTVISYTVSGSPDSPLFVTKSVEPLAPSRFLIYSKTPESSDLPSKSADGMVYPHYSGSNPSISSQRGSSNEPAVSIEINPESMVGPSDAIMSSYWTSSLLDSSPFYSPILEPDEELYFASIAPTSLSLSEVSPVGSDGPFSTLDSLSPGISLESSLGSKVFPSSAAGGSIFPSISRPTGLSIDVSPSPTMNAVRSDFALGTVEETIVPSQSHRLSDASESSFGFDFPRSTTPLPIGSVQPSPFGFNSSDPIPVPSEHPQFSLTSDYTAELLSSPDVEHVSEAPYQQTLSATLFETAATFSFQVTPFPTRSEGILSSPSPLVSLVDGFPSAQYDRYSESPRFSSFHEATSAEASAPPIPMSDAFEPSIIEVPNVSDVNFPDVYETFEIHSSRSLHQSTSFVEMSPVLAAEISNKQDPSVDFSVPQSSLLYSSGALSESPMFFTSSIPYQTVNVSLSYSTTPSLSSQDMSSPLESPDEEFPNQSPISDYLITPDLLAPSESRLHSSGTFSTSASLSEELMLPSFLSSEPLLSNGPHVWESEHPSISPTVGLPSVIYYSQDATVTSLSYLESTVVPSPIHTANVNFPLSSPNGEATLFPTFLQSVYPSIFEDAFPSMLDAPITSSSGTIQERLSNSPAMSDQLMLTAGAESNFATMSPTISEISAYGSQEPFQSSETLYGLPSISSSLTSLYPTVPPGKAGKSKHPSPVRSAEAVAEESSSTEQFPMDKSISPPIVTTYSAKAIPSRWSLVSQTFLPSFEGTFSPTLTEPQSTVTMSFSYIPTYLSIPSASEGFLQSEDAFESNPPLSTFVSNSAGISPEASEGTMGEESVESSAFPLPKSSVTGLSPDISKESRPGSDMATPPVPSEHEENYNHSTPDVPASFTAEVIESAPVSWTNDAINQEFPSSSTLTSQYDINLIGEPSSAVNNDFTPDISTPITASESALTFVGMSPTDSYTRISAPAMSQEVLETVPISPLHPTSSLEVPFSPKALESSEFPFETSDFGVGSNLPLPTVDFVLPSPYITPFELPSESVDFSEEENTVGVEAVSSSPVVIMSDDNESPSREYGWPSADVFTVDNTEVPLESWVSLPSVVESPTSDVAEILSSSSFFPESPDVSLFPSPPQITEDLFDSGTPDNSDNFPVESIHIAPSDSPEAVDPSVRPLFPSLDIQTSLDPLQTPGGRPDAASEMPDYSQFTSVVPSLLDVTDTGTMQPMHSPSSSIYPDAGHITVDPTPEESVLELYTPEPSPSEIYIGATSGVHPSTVFTDSPGTELDKPSFSSLPFPSSEIEADTPSPILAPSTTTISPDVIPIAPSKPSKDPGGLNGSGGNKSPSPGAEAPHNTNGDQSSDDSSGSGFPGGAGGTSVIAVVSIFAVLVIAAVLYKTCAVIPSIPSGFSISSIFGSSDGSNGKSGSDDDFYHDGVAGDDSPWDQVWRSASDLPEGTQREGEEVAARVGGQFAGLLKPGAARVRPPQVITRLAIPGMCMALSQLSPGSGSSVMSITTGFSSGPLSAQQTSLLEEDASIDGSDCSEEKPATMNFDMFKNFEAPKIDLLFVLDASGSLSWRDYRHVKELITKPHGLVDGVMRRAHDGSRVGFIEYAYDSVVVSELDRDQDLVRRRILSAFQGDANNWDHDGMFIYEVGDDVDGNALRKVDSLVSREGTIGNDTERPPTIQAKEVPPAMNGMSREAHLALKWSRFEMLPPVANRRIQAQLQRAVRLRRVVLVNGGELTKGGQSNGGLEAALSEKSKMERAGIRIITIGIGDCVEKNLKKLATRKYHLVTKSVKDLEKAIGRLTDMILRADMKHDGKFALHPPSILRKKRQRRYRNKQQHALYRAIGAGKIDPVKSISKGLPRRASDLPPWFTDGLS